ncbi:MAG TPA: MaoC family dehydratase N-terminal domain-containing protein [Dehalococcoidia bacterium]|nr:MaoC family dehydratase N-terminal domain-containing protein [Dehalococcoidia bacterium]
MAYDIEEVRRKYIGFETAKAKGRYPVEHDAIRRHCHMVEDRNPLHLDPQYAAAGTENGAVVCPPSGWLAMYFASLGPWPAVFEPLFPVVPTPGKRIVNMRQEVEWFARIHVGDHLSVVRRVTDVFQKGISIDPKAVWIVAEAEITNQRDEKVCVIRNTLLTHRTPEEVAAAAE